MDQKIDKEPSYETQKLIEKLEQFGEFIDGLIIKANLSLSPMGYRSL